MYEFVLVRVNYLRGKNDDEVDRGYVNEVSISRGRNIHSLLDVLGKSGFSMVNFNASQMAGKESFYFMLQRSVGGSNKPLSAVVEAAAKG